MPARSKIPYIQTTDLKVVSGNIANLGVTTASITSAKVTNLGVTTASMTTAVISTLSTKVGASDVPTTFTAAGVPGQILIPNSTQAFIYVCVSTNNWMRVAVSQTAFA